MADWSGRTVLVTGSTSGIGHATAATFAAGGASVVVHGEGGAEQAAAGLAENHRVEVIGCSADLRDPDAPGRLVEFAVGRTGRLDVLVNNAGVNIFRGVQQATLQDWSECLDLDLRAPWLCARAAAPHMPPGSAIVNVSSNHATATMAGVFPYNVAKAGCEALGQSLAIELGPLGIRVNTVRPGYVDTPINADYFAGFPDPAAARRRAEGLHLTGGLGRPQHVAATIEFLADEQASGFTTGSVLTVDGGRSALMEDPT